MPHMTSPSGLPLASTAFVTIVPVSPALRMVTVIPVFGELCKSIIETVSLAGNDIGNEREFVDAIRATGGCSGEENAERTEETVVHV